MNAEKFDKIVCDQIKVMSRKFRDDIHPSEYQLAILVVAEALIRTTSEVSNSVSEDDPIYFAIINTRNKIFKKIKDTIDRDLKGE